MQACNLHTCRSSLAMARAMVPASRIHLQSIHLFCRHYGYVHVPKEVPPHLLGPGFIWRKCYEVYPYSEIDDVLKKYQFLTKTSIYNHLPKIFNQHVQIEETLVQNLIERAEQFLVDRSQYASSTMKKSEVSDGLLQSLLTGIWQLGAKYPHIVNSHIARNPRVEMYWRRNSTSYICFPKPTNILFSTSPHQLFMEESITTADQILSPDIPVPEAYFNPITEIRLFQRSFDQIDVCGGCKRQSPYPFAHTLFMFQRSRNTTEQTHAHALMSMFCQTAAQTVQNGFKLDSDLVYPLSVQAILTDGRKFSFACFQLNTLDFRFDSKSSKENYLWLGPSLDLYSYISPNGELMDVDRDVVKYICQFLLNKPLRKRPPHSGFMLDTLKKIDLEKRRSLRRK